MGDEALEKIKAEADKANAELAQFRSTGRIFTIVLGVILILGSLTISLFLTHNTPDYVYRSGDHIIEGDSYQKMVPSGDGDYDFETVEVPEKWRSDRSGVVYAVADEFSQARWEYSQREELGKKVATYSLYGIVPLVLLVYFVMVEEKKRSLLGKFPLINRNWFG